MKYKIDRKYSPNKMSRKGHKPNMIVSHITEGSYNGAVSWLCNPKSSASSHFVVSKNGSITQLVDLREASWCNGTSTSPSKNTYYGKSTLQNVRNRRTNANYYTITIEHEGFSNRGQGKLTDKQFKATVWLHKYIRNEIKYIYGIDIPVDREHIVGHYQINPITKPNCPGQNFQFNQLIAELKGDNNKVIKSKPIVNKNVPSTWAKETWDLTKIKGYLDGTRPREGLTREELASVIVRILEG